MKPWHTNCPYIVLFKVDYQNKHTYKPLNKHTAMPGVDVQRTQQNYSCNLAQVIKIDYRKTSNNKRHPTGQ